MSNDDRCTPLHQALQVVGHGLGHDGAFHALDDEIGRLVPAQVAQHHFRGQDQGTGIHLILAGIARRGAMGSFEQRDPVGQVGARRHLDRDKGRGLARVSGDRIVGRGAELGPGGVAQAHDALHGAHRRVQLVVGAVVVEGTYEIGMQDQAFLGLEAALAEREQQLEEISHQLLLARASLQSRIAAQEREIAFLRSTRDIDIPRLLEEFGTFVGTANARLELEKLQAEHGKVRKELEQALRPLRQAHPGLEDRVPPAELRRLLQRQLAILKYIDFRFQPQIRISEEALREAWNEDYRGQPEGPPFEEAVPELRARLERRGLD